jgi:anti-sigma regulatory factor (Ser/Thr protein kinase)
MKKMRRTSRKGLDALDGKTPLLGEKDLAIARNIQSAMVPQRLPAMEGLEMASLYLPCRDVGGDLFDVVCLTEDTLAFYMFDVSGHGVGAALISSMAKVFFNEYIRTMKSPKQIVERVNARMILDISSDCYLTAIVAFLDLHDNRLTYCNAGHAYPIVYKGKEKTMAQLRSTGVFIGVSEKGQYEEKSVYCNPGDWLFFFTDGIYHVLGANNELQGRKLLEKEIARQTRHGSPKEFVRHIEKRSSGLPLGSRRDDDAIAVVIEFLTQSRKSQIKEKLGFKKDDPVYLQFINYFEEMDRTAAVILSAMDLFGYPDESIRKMKIILTELLANAIYHGNKGERSKKVTIGHVIDKKKAVISILDEGNGFNPKSIPDPTLPENLKKDSGRGLYIVKKYVDTLKFNSLGNRITVIKNNRAQ